MPNISPTTSLTLDQELANLSLYKYHPNGLVNHSLNRLQDMLDGKVEIVDPNNPFVYLLETSCLNTAFAIQEYTLLTRKLYPRLANSEEDLYLHMSDFDYLGRFSEPATASVKFNILFNDFKNLAYHDTVQNEYVLKLPRHLKVSVDKYVFTMTSAVIIRLTESGVIDVKFENQDFNNLFPVSTNFINFNLMKSNQTETYLCFDLKLPEVDIEAVEIPVEKSKLFQNTLTYNPTRRYYYFRAFHLLAGVWTEMVVTHTDEVYDINTPTCVVKVSESENSLSYYIPPVYVNTGMLGSKVKFLIYTTMGSISVNFNDYNVSDFSVEYNDVFPDQELDSTTQPLQLISKMIYVQDEVIDGKNGVTFVELKASVIDNSIGDRKLPITNKQIQYSVAQNNFKLIKDVDVVTNRIFLLETPIPNATTRYPIARFNMDIIEYATTMTDLKTGKNRIQVVADDILIIPEKTVFKLTENGLTLLDQVEYNYLVGLSGSELANEVNSHNYLSVFYHYILDASGNELNLRAYDISVPTVKQINFKEFNATAKVGINTTNTNIYQVSNGFGMDLLTNFKKYEDFVNETNLTAYMVYSDSEANKFYLPGRLYTVINDNPVFRFEFVTDYYINSDNEIRVQNFTDNNGNLISVALPLDATLELIYVSNYIPTTYQASEIDNYIYNTFISAGNCVVSLEQVSIKFGDYLALLNTQVHTSTGTYEYETYQEDVPLRYQSTVYGVDNEPLHQVNDIVYDENGEVVYQYLKGDIVLGENGQPVPVGALELMRYINLLFIDYKAVLGTKSTIVGYRNQLRTFLTEKITVNAVDVSNELLENTEAFVVVPKNIGYVRVKSNGRESYISSMQQFKVNLYVGSKVFNDSDIRDGLVYTVISTIDNYLYSNAALNKTELLNLLYGKLNQFVISVTLDEFTELNEEYIEILDGNSRVGLNKVLVSNPDGYDVSDDVSVNFMLIG